MRSIRHSRIAKLGLGDTAVIEVAQRTAIRIAGLYHPRRRCNGTRFVTLPALFHQVAVRGIGARGIVPAVCLVYHPIPVAVRGSGGPETARTLVNEA
ncbi:hypothetical protein D3C85_1589780 [compost metagenome]